MSEAGDAASQALAEEALSDSRPGSSSIATALRMGSPAVLEGSPSRRAGSQGKKPSSRGQRMGSPSRRASSPVKSGGKALPAVDMSDIINFVTDVRQHGADEVLQLPVSKTIDALQRMMQRVDFGEGINPTLEEYLGSVGRYFGKNPNYFESAGDDKVEVFEEVGKRTTKRTTTYWGWELRLYLEMPFYDERLKPSLDDGMAIESQPSAPLTDAEEAAETGEEEEPLAEPGADAGGVDAEEGSAGRARGIANFRAMPSKKRIKNVNYSIKYRQIVTEAEWAKLVAESPMTPSLRRRKTSEFLQAKLEREEPELQMEAFHGFWELTTNQSHHHDISRNRVLGIADGLKSDNWNIVRLSCACIWSLCTTQIHRRTFGDSGAVQMLVEILQDTMKLKLQTDPVEDGGKVKPGHILEEQRNGVQRMALGALAMMLVDKSCRLPLIDKEPDLKTLLQLCQDLPDYDAEHTTERRVSSARILCSLIQRDSDIRHSLISTGQLKTILMLMQDDKGPGHLQLCFCMAAALATLVLDDEVMVMVRERGEAPMMFHACMKLLQKTLEVMDSNGSEEMSVQHAVKLAEAAGQAMWGSAYECVQPGGGGVDEEHITLLADMAFQVLKIVRFPTSRVLHCVAATLATLVSNEDAAAVVMATDQTAGEGGPVNAMLEMLLVEEKEERRGIGHIRAAATTSIAFLAGHSFHAEGDECMFGPHRPRLLERGALDKLLEGALTKDQEEGTFKVIQHSAAVGVMYLSTMAGTVSAKALAMLAALMQNSSNVEMIEYLMAAFWILLRNSGNRRLLSEAFESNPLEKQEKQADTKLKAQLKDVSDTNEVSDSVEAAQRNLEQKFGGAHVQKIEDESGGDGKAAASAEPGLDPVAEDGPADDADVADAEGDGDKAEDKKSGGNMNKDWGLEILVQVGNTWIDGLMESDAVVEGDAPLLKLFEFLVASLTLFLIDEDEPVPPRRVDVFEMGVPRGGQKRQTWWSVAVVPAGVEAREPPAVESALRILCKLLSLKMPIGWKVVQLSVSSLWNCTARSASTEKLVVQHGAVEKLLDILRTDYWPATLREVAAGHVMALAEEYANIEHMGGTAAIQGCLIHLIKSKHPLLEMRAARYLGRITYSNPYLQPKPRAAMATAKANIASLDGVTQLIKLVVRCQKRYTLCLMSGNINFRPRRPSDGGEEASSTFEKDCNNMASVLECYFYTLATLLNLSTLKDNQVVIARKGLKALLGIISYFSREHLTTEAEGAMERRLYLLASSVVQNLSLHPKNRTSFYKAELKGSAALERELEGVDDVLVLPPVGTRSPGHGSPTLAQSSRGARAAHAKLSQSLPDIASLRPKVKFPMISPGGSLMPSAGSMGGDGMETQNPQDGEVQEETGRITTQPSMARTMYDEEEEDEEMKGKAGFLRWFEGSEELRTFGKPPDDSQLPSFARPKGLGRRRFDDDGNWLVDPNGLKGLPQLLRRPLNHLWEETPDHKVRNGAKRWEPGISEFRQPKASMNMGEVATRLLTTTRPNAADDLLRAAAEITKTGAISFADAPVTVDRPSTGMRKGGRMALTTLLPDDDVLMSTMEKPDEVKWDKLGAVQLNVVLAPNRERTNISFQDRLALDQDPTRAKLSVFEAVDGSKVYKKLFPEYQLPNGKRAHFYFQGGAVIDEQEVLLPAPPSRPSSIPAALQRKFPMTEVLNMVSRPPGSAPPFIPYKPVPKLAPVPEKHTLHVKAPNLFSMKAFGDLRADNLQFVVQFERTTTTEVQTNVEDVYVPPPEEKEPWELMKSIFKPRIKEADSRDFWDNENVVAKMFERDWQHACGKEKFAGFLQRENKANTNNDKPDDQTCIQQVHDVIKRNYKSFYSCFLYYASVGSGSPYHMQLNSWTMFLDAAGIPDVEAAYIKRSDCDTLFIVSNYVADKKDPLNKVNDEHALMRFEFLEAVVRAGVAKFGKGVTTVDVAEAVERIFLKCVLPSLNPYSSLWPNDFRETRLYTEECDDLLKKHSVLLKAIYSRYRLRPTGGGLRPKVLKLDGWLKMIDDTALVDSQYTLQDATQCFLWSRMAVIDELKDFHRVECLTFIDFLEAIGRVADLKFIPASSDLEQAGYENTLEWALAKEQLGDSEVEEGSIFKSRESCVLQATKTRPLYTKVELLLDLMFRRLFYDPMQPDTPYSKDALLRMVRKTDKEMGS